jgi:DNA-binding HxlR family transcriptional regulator
MDTIQLLALKGTMKILFSLEKSGTLRYSEIVDIVGYSTTATRALKRMQRQGILKREILDEPYRPVSYTLTDKGS